VGLVVWGNTLLLCSSLREMHNNDASL